MPSGLITFPLRLGFRSARLAIGLSERAVSAAWHTVESLIPGRDAASEARDARRPFPRDRQDDQREGSNGAAPDDTLPHDPRAEFELGNRRVVSHEAPPEPTVREAAADPAANVASDAAAAPEHIDPEVTLVESFAEPGAEDGAGAQIRIAEPFEGYSKLSAPDVIARLALASPAELATVELFEATSKRRSTVLSAVERQLKARTADAERSSRSQS